MLKIGRDAKRRVTFIAESNGDAIVYAYTDGRRARESLYRGFQNLEAPGTLVGDARFGYDDAGRLVDAFSPLFAGDSVATHHAHSDGGNVTLAQDENGRQDSYLYTALDQLRQIDQMRAGPVTYTTGVGYGERADLEQVSDPAASVTSYQRDDLGRLVRLTSPDTGATLYLYDEAGNRIEKIEGFGVSPRSTRYEYDGLDRVVRIDTPNDPDWIFSYDTDAAKNQKGRLASPPRQRT